MVQRDHCPLMMGPEDCTLYVECCGLCKGDYRVYLRRKAGVEPMIQSKGGIWMENPEYDNWQPPKDADLPDWCMEP